MAGSGWERANKGGMGALGREGGDRVWCWLERARREGWRELRRKERVCGGGWMLKALKYFLSQKCDLLSDCQWGGHRDGHTYRVTMRGVGLSCN